MTQTEVVILGGARTPFTRLLGALASQSAVDLGALAISEALNRSGIAAADVEQVIMGQVLQAGAGQNPARQSAIGAGIGWDVPTVTINKVCLSGLVAITDAARLIRSGEASVVVAGGQESMTNAPHVLPGARAGFKYGSTELLDVAAHDGLTDAFDRVSMGISTERHNTPLGISRQEQDAVATASHVRAAAAAQGALFDTEIVPVEIAGRKGAVTVVDADEGIRADSTPESLSKLRPAFDPEGTITAGNSSPLSDGAAAVVVADRAWAEERGLEWLAVLRSPGQVAGPDTSLHSQPSRAIEHALSRQGWSAAELDLVEINEAFAAVAIQSMRDLGLENDIVNIHGGAIAIGHPIGASGARLALHAALELSRRGSGRAAVSLCGGGGQGEALLLER
ncbi:acetyl-CoA C-acetyltransferase [Microbacterium sp. MPKO10]|uniref:acetyl-CoA C-acetyltransferase n=1 Tax=Microbacterium sp. MPKO10 TaxID=2989818 RepID=UPI0022361EF6|nr:acetyl-CoA C-acetyltransferase [Microbacterium sp. MPKO10]MCW4458344.1 acetyl-CoA C-acetyltransferase [Microbacterium sp. MPKO10]